MAEFKLNISDPKTKTSFKKEVKDDMAGVFLGMKLGQNVKGDSFELAGYEFEITGGSDNCGFPMRKGIKAPRHKIYAKGGVGHKSKRKGTFVRKTVCGETIHDKIRQVNLKVLKAGKAPLGEAKAEEGDAKPAEEKPKAEEKKEAPKEEKKPEAKEKPKAETKPAEEKKEEPKKEEAKEEKKE